jgi:hypothetical protein
MRRWITISLTAIALTGCATGFPGSPTRSFYNLCMIERGEAPYCEAWAAVEAIKLTPRVQPSILMQLPTPGR